MYCRSRKDGREGYVYLIINNALTETTGVELPKEAEIYSLSGNGDVRSTVAYLNGRPLVLNEEGELPQLEGELTAAGKIELPPASCTFIVL